MQFGQYVKEQRHQLGISSRKLSEKVGKSSSYISSIEKGLYKLDFSMAYRILTELRIENSSDSILEVLSNFGFEAPVIPGTDSIFFHHDLGGKSTELSASKNSEEPDYQKSYEDRQKDVIVQLRNITEQIIDDLSSYPLNYNYCSEDSVFETEEKFITTFTSIMLSNEMELFNKFHKLMELPLHKLNPLQFQKLIDCASDLLEYEYVFESGENSKTQKYPHYRVKYKEK
ncbi:helix-turn-helix domain-containing protein [Desulfosporosinus nitroreducens]|uniref:Helix-turn-helix transcriptional regulator n=1 Tax=Desulfosporosinus nitroreducens TaxID=2018668 RepID=A0ABT8QRG6_9FIRM|nr:helix-turn-helix transcriptional regulator [Desulfosporosinus nitroreducens]MDO0823084.1 helix-turn-helix transcriptional regulator [Desulfosporosinus nitroreducens]